MDPPAPRAPRSSPLSLVFHHPPARLRPPRGNFRRLGILQSEPRHESIHRAFRLTSAAFTEKICAASSLPPSSNPSPSFANPSASSESSLTRLCLPPSPGPPSSLTPPSETPVGFCSNVFSGFAQRPTEAANFLARAVAHCYKPRVRLFLMPYFCATFMMSCVSRCPLAKGFPLRTGVSLRFAASKQHVW